MQERIQKFEEILEKELKKELDRINNAGALAPNDVKTISDAICLMLKTKEYEEWENGGKNSYGSYAPEGYSTRRGRSATTGRYVSRDMDPMMRSYGEEMYPERRSYRGFYDQGYSGHSIKDRMIAQLEGMYDEAKSEHERQLVDEWINRLETAR